MRWWAWSRDEEDDNRLQEAEQARDNADAHLAEVRDKVEQNKTVVDKLAEIRRRNHFRELLEQAIK